MGESAGNELEVDVGSEASEPTVEVGGAAVDAATEHALPTSLIEEETGSEPAVEPVPEEPASAEEGGDQDPLRPMLARLDSRLEESQRLLARQSDLVDKLHAENQSLRAGEIRSAQMPLVRDLLRLHDDVGRMRSASADSEDLRLVHESLVETLARNGIESFAPERGDRFDPSAHSAGGVERTDDATLDKTVAEVVRRGFRWDSGDLIRVTEVRAYRYFEPG